MYTDVSYGCSNIGNMILTIGRMECRQFQKSEKWTHFSINVLQIVHVLLQLCVHFYERYVHFYKCAFTFTNSAFLILLGILKLMARHTVER